MKPPATACCSRDAIDVVIDDAGKGNIVIGLHSDAAGCDGDGKDCSVHEDACTGLTVAALQAVGRRKGKIGFPGTGKYWYKGL